MDRLLQLSHLARIERHPLGPRVFVLRRRVHECHAGLAFLAIAVVGLVSGLLHPLLDAAAAVGGTLLVAKDWRDLFASTRDTAGWRMGMHRPPDAPAPRPLRERVPLLAGVATAAVGTVNVLSAITPELPGRVQALLTVAPVHEVALAHALALPAGLALCATAVPLGRRRHRALCGAVGLLGALGVLNLVKGLDIEEATVSVALAAGLWRARPAFWVRHDTLRHGPALRRAATIIAGAAGAGTVAVLAAGSAVAGPGGPLTALVHALSLLTLSSAVPVREPFAWLPAALAITGIGAALSAGGILLAPARWRGPADAAGRLRASTALRAGGSGDTLAAFKLRSDLAHLWSPDGRAFAAYRVKAGAMLLSGDPVGPTDAVPGLLAAARRLADELGLALGVVGASDAFCAQARPHGLRPLYLGDEALLDCGVMDLSGQRNKSLRKAVNRVARNGYVAQLQTVADLDGATTAALERISATWRDGAPERGFSMSHDRLDDPLLTDAQVVVARDEHGSVRGFLQFVPVFGRPAVSLAFMRRDRDTPNGLTDFLVVEAARLLGEAGMQELSLNFSAFGSWLRAPETGTQRVLARLLDIGDRWFQVRRLLSFNAKFDPRWQPRYLLFDSPARLPRLAVAAMIVEGQLPTVRELLHLPDRPLVAAASPAHAA